MRWGSSGNANLGVGATSYTFATRDENASYYYYQEPSVPLGTSTSAFGVSQPRGVGQAKKPPDKRHGRRIVGSNTRTSGLNREFSASSGQVNNLEVTSRQRDLKARPPLIVCSGKSVSSPSGDSSGCEDRDDTINQHSDIYSSRVVPDNNDKGILHSNRSTPFQAITGIEPKKTNELDSPRLCRSDEELERIIRDLRDQVFQKQDQVQTLQTDENNDKFANDGCQTQRHSRKHLKNPVERMEGTSVSVPVAASMEARSTTNNLQRPLSSSQLNRFMAENTVQIVVPAIISEGPVRTSSSNNLFSALDFSSLRSSSSRSSFTSSSNGTEKKSSRLRDVNLRPNKSSASSRTRRGHEKVDELDRYNDFNDCGESFLYLVDVSDNNDENEALSPVGPWIIDDISSAAIATDTPRSPSVSTCYSVSSLGSEDLNVENGGEWKNTDLTTMSPRSRLLYFSDCADDCETSRTSQMHWQTLHRSATCRTGIVPSEKPTKSTRPKRCSSANVNTRGKSRTTSSSSGIPKQKTRNRVRKRPQSGGAVGPQVKSSDTI